MKVLITGARGMLGQELVRVFERGNEVTAWDFEDLDVTDKKLVEEKLLALEPELIINAVGYNNVDRAESEPEKANAVNGEAVGYLAAAAKQLDIPIVHYSTEYVFDGENQDGYREDARPNPISAYGQSKYLGEQRLSENTEKFYLIRLSRLFGKPGSSAEAKESFIVKMLAAGEKGEIDGVDGEWSMPTYAPDLAQRTRFIVDRKFPFGIYHCTSTGPAPSWYDLAVEIFKILGRSVKVNHVDATARPAKRPKYGVLVNTKISAPMRDWREALREFLTK